MRNELILYYNLIHTVWETATVMTGEDLQKYSLRCTKADEQIQKVCDKTLAKEDNGDLFLIRHFRQRRQAIRQLISDVMYIQVSRATLGATDIHAKRHLFLGKVIDRHLRSLENIAKETEIQLHLGAVQELHDAVSIKQAGGKRFLQFVSAN